MSGAHAQLISSLAHFSLLKPAATRVSLLFREHPEFTPTPVPLHLLLSA